MTAVFEKISVYQARVEYIDEGGSQCWVYVTTWDEECRHPGADVVFSCGYEQASRAISLDDSTLRALAEALVQAGYFNCVKPVARN